MKQKKKASRVTAVRYPHCAGIDVAKDLHAVALPPDDQGEQEVKFFNAFTVDLLAMADWLNEHRVQQVAMESTGVYWIPVREVLDAYGFDTWLVNPIGLARPDRRKSDVLDCQWLQQLMSLGLLSKSHRPADEICELRSYVRNRQRLIQDRARCVQHMQKAMQQMNVKLDSVLSDVSGKSGMRIIEAIVGGERDAQALAGLCDRRVKKSESEIAAALLGNWRNEHLFALQQALESYQHYSGQLQQMEVRILALVELLAAQKIEEAKNSKGAEDDDSAGAEDDGSAGAEDDDSAGAEDDGSAGAEDDDSGGRKGAGAADRQPVNRPRRKWQQQLQMSMWDLFGVDLTAIPGVGVETALVLLSELGHDFSEFDNVRKFSHWLGLTPGTNISGGRRLPGGAKGRGTQRAGQSLRLSAMTLRRSQCALGDKHRRRCSRMDPPRAVKASAHEVARIMYSMVTNGTEYKGMDREAMAEQTHQRRLKRLRSEAKSLGLELVHNQAVA